jgi:hypothetical protein
MGFIVLCVQQHANPSRTLTIQRSSAKERRRFGVFVAAGFLRYGSLFLFFGKEVCRCESMSMVVVGARLGGNGERRFKPNRDERNIQN